MSLRRISRILFIVAAGFYVQGFFLTENALAAGTEEERHYADSVSAIALDYIFNLNFSSAASCTDKMKSAYPQHPAGVYLMLVADFYRIIAGVDYPWDEDRFVGSHDSFLAQLESSEKLLSSDDVNFYRGCAYGNLARYWGSQGNWANAFLNARKAKRLHEAVSASSPHFHDAQLTPGVYNYYAATLPKWVSSIASLIGLGGDKDLGIRQLSETAEKGSLHRTEALFILIQVLMNEGRYEQALDISKRLMKQYPDNPYLKNQTAVILFVMDDFRAAEPLFTASLNKSSSRYAPCSHMALYHLGRIHLMKSDYTSARDYFNRVFRIESLTARFEPTHGWIAGSARYYAGLGAEHLELRDEAEELYRTAASQENVNPLIKVKSKFRLKYPMNERQLRIEALIHQLTSSAGIPDSAQCAQYLKDASDENYPGLINRLEYAVGKRYIINKSYVKAFPHLISALNSTDDYPDKVWVMPEVYYYLAECAASVNDISKIQEYLEKAGSYKDYPGESRMRYLYDNMLNALYR